MRISDCSSDVCSSDLHRDTLRSENHVGSIVVLLGPSFTGGEFLVNGEPVTLEIDSSGNKLPFVAFYTDILHEVRPLTSGVRVSLQFRSEERRLGKECVRTCRFRC